MRWGPRARNHAYSSTVAYQLFPDQASLYTTPSEETELWLAASSDGNGLCKNYPPRGGMINLTAYPTRVSPGWRPQKSSLGTDSPGRSPGVFPGQLHKVGRTRKTPALTLASWSARRFWL